MKTKLSKINPAFPPKKKLVAMNQRVQDQTSYIRTHEKKIGGGGGFHKLTPKVGKNYVEVQATLSIYKCKFCDIQ